MRPTPTPEILLLFAMLERAVRDYFGHPGADQRSADVWLFSNNTAPFGYLWVCEHMNLEPTPMRRRLLRLVKDARKQFAANNMFSRRIGDQPSNSMVIDKICDPDEFAGQIGEWIYHRKHG